MVDSAIREISLLFRRILRAERHDQVHLASKVSTAKAQTSETSLIPASRPFRRGTQPETIRMRLRVS
jgi:hypothetical protein